MAKGAFTLIANRGASTVAPENTICAFEAAAKAGADGISCDPRQTKDGATVLCRDASLFRTTAREAQVRDLTLAEIKSLDAGSFHDHKFAGTSIPTLEEALAVCHGRLQLEMEIAEAGVLVATLQALQKCGETAIFEKVLLTSFQKIFLITARCLDGRARLGLLLEPRTSIEPIEAKLLGVTTVLPHWEDTSKAWVDDVHKLGLQVRVWGATNLDQAQKAWETGADGLSYGNPAELTPRLRELGLRAEAEAAKNGNGKNGCKKTV